MEDRYIIIDLVNCEYWKDLYGNVKVFESEEDARVHCGVYEPENVWICKLVYNYIDDIGNETKID